MALPSSRSDREYQKFVEDVSGDVAVRIVAEDALPTSGGASGGGENGYTAKPSGSNGDAVSAYASGTTITVTGLPYTFTKYDISSIQQIPTSGSVTTFSSVDKWTVSGTTITVPTGVFAASDTFIVSLTGETRSYTIATDSKRVEEIDPLDQKYVPGNLVDTTNVSAATHYYPSATGSTMDGFQDQSMTGKFIDADGTLTLTLEVSNDEDSTNADWNGAYFYDDELNATVNTKTVTNGTELFSLSCNNNNFSLYRWVVVASGATNTVILKERKKAL